MRGVSVVKGRSVTVPQTHGDSAATGMPDDIAPQEQKWALQQKWHRIASQAASLTLCGVHLPGDLAIHPTEEVVIEIAKNRTSVCGTCDRLANGAIEGSVDSQQRDTRHQLSAKQLEVRRRLDEEKVRRAAARHGAEVDKASRDNQGTSVRTVSGGLPTIGKGQR